MPCIARHDNKFGIVSSRSLAERDDGSSAVEKTDLNGDGAVRFFGRDAQFPYAARFGGVDYQGEGREHASDERGDPASPASSSLSPPPSSASDSVAGECKTISPPRQRSLPRLALPHPLGSSDSAPPSLLRDVALDALATRRAFATSGCSAMRPCRQERPGRPKSDIGSSCSSSSRRPQWHISVRYSLRLHGR